jgi:hypothetical protein
VGPNFVLDKGFIADTAVTQFYGVKQSADDHVTIATVLGEAVLGFAQESNITAGDAANGRVIDVRIMGITRAVCSAAITRGARVRIAADGRVAPLAAATANQNQVGIALTGTANANEHLDLLLTPGVSASVA